MEEDSGEIHNIIAMSSFLEKTRFENVFRPHENEKPQARIEDFEMGGGGGGGWEGGEFL